MITNYNNELRFYNYLYLDPEKPGQFLIKGLDLILRYEPFYAGKGTGNRIDQHLYGRSKGFMKSKIISFEERGVIPIKLKINNNISNFEACCNEKYLIKAIGRRDLGLGSLVNLTDGGEDGTVGYKHTKESKAKMSAGSKSKVYTKEYREKLSKARRGKKFSDEHKRNLSISMKGKHTVSNENKLKIREVSRKDIEQYSLDSIFIKAWESMIDASKSLGIEVSGISKNCRGICRTSHGFIWKYKNSKND